MLNREPRIPTTRKAEGEHLDNPARVRFKDSEYLALEQVAAMRHGGRYLPRNTGVRSCGHGGD